MNDTVFSEGFSFHRCRYERTHHYDNRGGTQTHFLAYLEKGHARLVGEEETVELAEGDAFYIPFGCRYQSYWCGDPQIEFLSFAFLYMPCLTGGGYPMQVVRVSEEEVMQMKALLSPVTDAHIGRLYTLIATLTPRMRRTPLERGRALFEAAGAVISREPHLDIREVARQCRTSTSALYAAFSRYSDTTPNELRNRVLCERARELLITTDTPVEEVGRLVGFSSPAYFRKVMHGVLGLSPREVRRERRI